MPRRSWKTRLWPTCSASRSIRTHKACWNRSYRRKATSNRGRRYLRSQGSFPTSWPLRLGVAFIRDASLPSSGVGSRSPNSKSSARAGRSPAICMTRRRRVSEPDRIRNEVLFAARGLRKHFDVKGGVLQRTIAKVRAVDGVDLAIRRGETVALVGESGCGKTTLGRLLLRLIEPTEGDVLFNVPESVYQRIRTNGSSRGKDDGAVEELVRRYSMTRLRRRAMKSLRRFFQPVFQDPFTSLDPRMLIKDILAEPLIVNNLATRLEAYDRAAKELQEVGLRPEHLDRFPHEFSGGQRQRIAIARALVSEPESDQPTDGLSLPHTVHCGHAPMRLEPARPRGSGRVHVRSDSEPRGGRTLDPGRGRHLGRPAPPRVPATRDGRPTRPGRTDRAGTGGPSRWHPLPSDSIRRPQGRRGRPSIPFPGGARPRRGRPEALRRLLSLSGSRDRPRPLEHAGGADYSSCLGSYTAMASMLTRRPGRSRPSRAVDRAGGSSGKNSR